MSKLTQEQINFLRLIDRSMKGREWATVSDTLWPMTERIAAALPSGPENRLVRLTSEGNAIVAFM
jgi:hypothetical protein